MKDFLGAFSDGAILFPLLAVLSLQGAMPADHLLFTAGLAYIASGLWFRIPMPVQPLKSIAIAAVAVHASGMEIRLSGILLGVVCLLLAIFIQNPRVHGWVRAIPPFFVRALQTALGVILAIQGLKILIPLSFFEKSVGAIFLAALFIFSSLPLLGIAATLGLVAGVFLSAASPHEASGVPLAAMNLIRPEMIAALVIPQIALTFANSVLSTKEVAIAYFNKAAHRVTERSLLSSIGIGNLVAGALSGLPYCHGAGGLTAHYRGGARTLRANLIIGSALLLAAGLTHFGDAVVLRYPLFLLGGILIAIGWFHFGLVRMQKTEGEGLKLAMIAVVAGFTQNMTWPLVAAVALSFIPENSFKFPESLGFKL